MADDLARVQRNISRRALRLITWLADVVNDGGFVQVEPSDADMVAMRRKFLANEPAYREARRFSRMIATRRREAGNA